MTNAADATDRLAVQAFSLSQRLQTCQSECHHEKTSNEISLISEELCRMSDTLVALSQALAQSSDSYTTAFYQDLEEITTELKNVFEEIVDCCTDLQATDSNGSNVLWFFKQGRINRLLKHLNTLKGTLAVMRAVLWHGKDYGTHTSDRLAESSPHTMHEDRVILESILASNRDAIQDLYDHLPDLKQTTPQAPEDSGIERTTSRAGDHHRSISDEVGVDMPEHEDRLPPPRRGTSFCDLTFERKKDNTSPARSVSRTFSKRGVRLGVHASILDMDAHNAPQELKNKWLCEARERQRQARADTPGSNRSGAAQPPELSRISEVDSNAALSRIDLRVLSTINLDGTLRISSNQSEGDPGKDTISKEVPSADAFASTSLATPRKRRASTLPSNLRRVLSKLSLNRSSPTSTTSTQLNKAVSNSSKARTSRHARLHSKDSSLASDVTDSTISIEEGEQIAHQVPQADTDMPGHLKDRDQAERERERGKENKTVSRRRSVLDMLKDVARRGSVVEGEMGSGGTGMTSL